MKLDDNQRRVLIDHLTTREKATFDDIRKKLGFLESVKFNLERGKRPSIKGMVTDHLLANKVGKEWHQRSEDEKDEIVHLLLDGLRDDRALAARLCSEFGFTKDQTEAALGIDFQSGYSKVSLVAIDTPHQLRPAASVINPSLRAIRNDQLCWLRRA